MKTSFRLYAERDGVVNEIASVEGQEFLHELFQREF
jgi:biotin carboxyl carrier protein